MLAPIELTGVNEALNILSSTSSDSLKKVLSKDEEKSVT